MSSGARNSVKKFAQLIRPRTLASANVPVTSNTKKIPVSTRNMAPTTYAMGVEK